MKFFTVEKYDDYDSVWSSIGYFSTKEKAEKFLADYKKYDECTDEDSAFRIDWHIMDERCNDFADEHDGQPDEMQEWLDFDPDC